MAEQIIIEDGLVRHVRTEIISETLLNNLAPHLTTELPLTFPVLPQRPVRFISFDPEAGNGLMIVETTPKRHVIQVRHGNHESYATDAARRDPDGISRFNVLLPYQYFAYSFTAHRRASALVDFTINQSFLFWAKDPFRTPIDPVWPAPCPNVDASGSICWGSTNSDSSSLSARIDDLVNNFYTTVFNEDLGHRTPFGTSLTEWEENSIDALSYRDWPLWDTPAIAVERIAQHMRTAAPTNIAELNPSFIELPDLPENFTLARAQEWIGSLNDGARRRLFAATTLYATETGEREDADEPTALEIEA